MSLIKITSIPPGEEPMWVRKAWVGVEIPIPKHRSGGTKKNVLSGIGEVNSYQVDIRKAVDTLLKTSPDAARWWRQNVSLGVEYLVFPKNVCALVP